MNAHGLNYISVEEIRECDPQHLRTLLLAISGGQGVVVQAITPLALRPVASVETKP